MLSEEDPLIIREKHIFPRTTSWKRRASAYRFAGQNPRTQTWDLAADIQAHNSRVESSHVEA